MNAAQIMPGTQCAIILVFTLHPNVLDIALDAKLVQNIIHIYDNTHLHCLCVFSVFSFL